MKNTSILAAAAAALTLGACATQTTSSAAMMDDNMRITEAAVLEAQEEWGEGIVAIAEAYRRGNLQSAQPRALQHIDDLYAYGMTDVMFKPTLAATDQFRENRDEALSYFIGRPGTEDGGFAISDWTDVRWENNAIYTDTDSAMAMGNYYFTNTAGEETKVEYTFGYVPDADGDLRINLHHSSLPYDPS